MAKPASTVCAMPTLITELGAFGTPLPRSVPARCSPRSRASIQPAPQLGARDFAAAPAALQLRQRRAAPSGRLHSARFAKPGASGAPGQSHSAATADALWPSAALPQSGGAAPLRAAVALKGRRSARIAARGRAQWLASLAWPGAAAASRAAEPARPLAAGCGAR